MARQTVKIGSAGKIFSVTGWKVGFVIADPALLAPIARAHQYLTFTTPPALQAGVAFGLGKEEAWFAHAQAGYQRARDRLRDRLVAAGFAVLASEATYFLCIDLAGSRIDQPDHAFCHRAVREAQVAMIPLSAFYAQQAETGIVRLCFAKSDDVLDHAAERLEHFRRTCA